MRSVAVQEKAVEKEGNEERSCYDKQQKGEDSHESRLRKYEWNQESITNIRYMQNIEGRSNSPCFLSPDFPMWVDFRCKSGFPVRATPT